jgi:hypothetical protein
VSSSTHRCATEVDHQSAGLAVVRETAEALVADQWVAELVPQLRSVVDERLPMKQRARLHTLQHWVDAWYRRSGAASRREAEGRATAIARHLRLGLPLTPRHRRSIVWALLLHGLPGDLVEFIHRLL